MILKNLLGIETKKDLQKEGNDLLSDLVKSLNPENVGEELGEEMASNTSKSFKDKLKYSFKDAQKDILRNNAINSININTDGLLLSTTQVTDYTLALEGLNLQESQNVLSTQGLTLAQQQQVLANAGLISSNEAINASMLQQELQTTTLTVEQQQELLATLGLVDAKTGESIATATCTAEEIKAAMASKGYSAAKIESIMSTLGYTTVTETATATTAGFTGAINLNTAAIKAWMTTNPMGWIMLLIGGIAAVTSLIKNSTETTEEFINKQHEAKSEIESTISSLQNEVQSAESLQQQLINAKGNKESLIQVQSQLNDLLGINVNLLDDETNGYDVATTALNDYINRKNDALDFEKQNQVNNAIDTLDGLRIKSTGLFGLDWTSNDKNFGDIGKEYYDELVSWVNQANITASNFDPSGFYSGRDYWTDWGQSFFGFSKVDEEAFKSYFSEAITQVDTLIKIWDNDWKSSFEESELLDIGHMLFYSGITDPNQLRSDMEDIVNNYNFTDLINQYYASLSDSSIDSNALYEQIQAIFDEIIKKYPVLKSELIDYFNTISTDIQNGVDQVSSSFNDIFTLEDSSGTINDLGKISESIDKIQEAYSTLNDAIDEYNNNGAISIDTLQSIITLGDDWLDYLVDENGNLKLDKQSLEDLTQSRLLDMQAQIQQSIIDNATQVYDDATANEYLATTNYALADSIEAVTEQKLKDAAIKIQNNVGEDFTQSKADVVIKKMYDDASKVQDLFSNINLNSLGSDSGGSGSGSSSTLDFIEYRLKEIEDAANKVQSAIDETVGAADKNALIDQMQEVNDAKADTLTKSIKYYTNKSNEYLSQIPDNLKSAAQNGAIAITEFIGDSNDATVEAIQNYREMSDSIADATEQLAELRQEVIRLEKEKFDNIKNAFEDISNIITDNTSLIDSQISFLEDAGERVGSGYYSNLIEQSKLYLEQLKKERSMLNNQLSSAMSNGVKYGSDEWNDMYSSIQAVDKQIIETTSNIENYGDALQKLDWNVFDDTVSAIDRVKDEISNLVSLLDTDDNVSGNIGGYSSEAIGSIGLYMEQMDDSKYIVEKTNEEIEKLGKSYNNGELTLSEYTERLETLEDTLWNNISAYNDAKDAIEELAKARVEEEIDSINEATDAESKRIDALKDELQAEKDLENYRRSLEEKQAEIDDIQSQINARSGSTDAATIAEREKLEADLANKLKDLKQTQEDQAYNDMVDGLDKEQESYEKSQQDRIEALEDSLKDSESLIQNAMNTTLANSNTVLGQLNTISQTWGLRISSNVTSPWNKGSESSITYAETVSKNLDNISSTFVKLQNQANASSYNISASIGAIDTTNLYTMIGILSNSINTTKLTSSINTIKSTVDELASSIGKVSEEFDKLGNKNTSSEKSPYWVYRTLGSYSTNGEASSKIGMLNGDQIIKVGKEYVVVKWLTGFKSNGEASSRISSLSGSGVYKRYRKGGMLGKSSNELDSMARTIGEDHIGTIAWKDDERILTPEQNKAFLEGIDLFSKLQQNGIMSDLVKVTAPNTSIIGNNMNPALSIGSMLTVEGNVSEDSLPQLQKMLDKSKNEIFNEFGRMLVNKSSVRAR